MYIFNVLRRELESLSESDLKINYFHLVPVQSAVDEIYYRKYRIWNSNDSEMTCFKTPKYIHSLD